MRERGAAHEICWGGRDRGATEVGGRDEEKRREARKSRRRNEGSGRSSLNGVGVGANIVDAVAASNSTLQQQKCDRRTTTVPNIEV